MSTIVKHQRLSVQRALSALAVLPIKAQQRLLMVAIGWVFVAFLEAVAYSILAFAIVYHWSPKWVLISAGVAVFVTVLVNRSGYLTGVRLAGDLFSVLGHALSRTKLSWFNNAHRSQVVTIAGQGIPEFMSIPAHQLQNFLHAPFMPLFLTIGMGLLAGIKVALVALILLVLSLLSQYLSQRMLVRIDAKRHKAQANTAQATLELIEHMDLLRSTVGATQAIKRVETRWQGQETVLKATNNASAIAVDSRKRHHRRSAPWTGVPA